jgi:hypothetical protein
MTGKEIVYGIIFGALFFLAGTIYQDYKDQRLLKAMISEEDAAIDNLVKHLFKGDLV